MTNAALLNTYIQATGLKKSYLADKLGLTPVQFSLCATGRREFTGNQMDILCDLIGVEDPEEKQAIFFAEFVALKATV